VEREKKKADDLVRAKDRHIRDLERMLENQETLKHNLDLAQSRLKASELFVKNLKIIKFK